MMLKSSEPVKSLIRTTACLANVRFREGLIFLSSLTFTRPLQRRCTGNAEAEAQTYFVDKVVSPLCTDEGSLHVAFRKIRKREGPA